MKLTQEQLAELIAKVFTNLDEKRKARKETEGEIEGISTDDILGALTEILDNVAEDPATTGEGEGEGKAAEDPAATGEGECGAVTPELIAKVVAALEGIKSGAGTTETKAAEPVKTPAPAPARKYANLFISTGASRDGGDKAMGFKARMESMTGPERRKTAYGMFGRAVKCLNASHGDIEKAAYTAEHKFMDTEMAHEFKALSMTSPSDGGYLVPEVYANEIIELLYPATVIYSLGARRLGMANAATSTAGYIHPGVIKYLTELGYSIKEDQIPPEAK